MKKIAVLLLLLLFATSLFAQNQNDKTHKSEDKVENSISLDAIPKSVKEFKEMRAKLAKTEKGAAAMMILAMLAFDKDPKLSEQFFILMLHRRYIIKSKNQVNIKDYALSREARRYITLLFRRKYIAHAYIKESNFKEGYQIPKKAPYHVLFSHLLKYPSVTVVYLKINKKGERPRPIYLKKNNSGIYKVYRLEELYATMPYQAPDKISKDL